MTLPEAIRLGSMVTKPVKTKYLIVDSNGQTFACALGAAGCALGLIDEEDYEAGTGSKALRRMFPELLETFGPEPWNLEARIMWKNDVAGWSREQVADWIESLGIPLTGYQPACPDLDTGQEPKPEANQEEILV